MEFGNALHFITFAASNLNVRFSAPPAVYGLLKKTTAGSLGEREI
jgi:hypothetical protein